MDAEKRKKKPFDFSKFKQRHIALKILYFGWDYDGLAEQANCDNTIEHHLFKALTKTCLIEARKQCNYNRCGRTDKGVSSYSQVVNLSVRSNLLDETNPQNLGLFCPPGFDTSKTNDSVRTEINYTDTLNKLLPDHIRALAWAPVDAKFSSRFDCHSRSYSYIFPRGDLCIDSMQEALSYLIGDHDFRNLCSFDLKNGVINHNRTILETAIHPIRSIDAAEAQTDTGYKFYEIVIVGRAFLYHQIRCIMTILFLIGTRKEEPGLIKDLLDINKCPSQPNYNRASALPLSLFECQYIPELFPLGWIHDEQSVLNIYKQLKRVWSRYKIKSMMIERVLMDFEKSSTVRDETSSGLRLDKWKDFGIEFDTMSDTKYVPIMKRPRDETLEVKLQTLQTKRRKHDEQEQSLSESGIP